MTMDWCGQCGTQVETDRDGYGGCPACGGAIVPYSGPPPGPDDFDDVHHALGRPRNPKRDTYRNHYCTAAGGDTARRFEALGWWDFVRTINDGRDAIYCVNGTGKAALAEWLKQQRSAAE